LLIKALTEFHSLPLIVLLESHVQSQRNVVIASHIQSASAAAVVMGAALQSVQSF